MVIGEKEKEDKMANVRTRDEKVHGSRSIKEIISLLKKEIDEKSLNSLF